MKRILLLAVLSLSTAALFAQQKVGTFSVMPKVGLNIASLTDYPGSDPRIALVFGADVEYQYSDIISFSAGMNYSMQGGKCSSGGIEETIKGDFVNVPLLVNVYLLKNFAVKIGLQPAFNVNGKYKIEGGTDDYETDLDMKTMDLSIPIGVSYEFDNLVVDARYNWGLTKIIDYSDYRNSVFQITLGYKLPI